MSEQTLLVRPGDLVLDWDLYPRGEVDAGNIGRLVDALRAGATLPPLLIDRASRRIVDGVHRYRALSRLGGEDAEIPVIARDYPDDAAIFLDAVRLNAGHGRPLGGDDRRRCVVRANMLRVDPARIAEALGITSERVGELWTPPVKGEVSAAGPASAGAPATIDADRPRRPDPSMRPQRLLLLVRELRRAVQGKAYLDDKEVARALWLLGETIAQARAKADD